MPWPGPRYLSRPAPFALAMIVWLLPPMGATPARAAGCHIPERPVLAAPLSWERPTRLAAWQMTDEVHAAPRVLTRIPCPGEVPQVPVGVSSSPAATSLSPAEPASLVRSESLRIVDDLPRREPRPGRLDRPPR